MTEETRTEMKPDMTEMKDPNDEGWYETCSCGRRIYHPGPEPASEMQLQARETRYCRACRAVIETNDKWQKDIDEAKLKIADACIARHFAEGYSFKDEINLTNKIRDFAYVEKKKDAAVKRAKEYAEAHLGPFVWKFEEADEKASIENSRAVYINGLKEDMRRVKWYDTAEEALEVAEADFAALDKYGKEALIKGVPFRIMLEPAHVIVRDWTLELQEERFGTEEERERKKARKAIRRKAKKGEDGYERVAPGRMQFPLAGEFGYKTIRNGCTLGVWDIDGSSRMILQVDMDALKGSCEGDKLCNEFLDWKEEQEKKEE